MKRNALFRAVLICFLLAPPNFWASPQSVRGQAIEAPFVLENGLIVIPVRIKDKGPYNMVLATGSSYSFLSVEMLSELDIVGNYSYLNHNPLTGRLMTFATVPDIRIGGLHLTSLQMRLGSLEILSQQSGQTIHGQLGHDFLRGRLLQIDYPNQVLRFLQASASPAGQSANAPAAAGSAIAQLEFPQEEPQPIVREIFINGQKIKALLDTGQAGALALTPAAVRQLGLPEAESGIPFRLGTVDSLRIGSLQFSSPRTAFYARGRGLDHATRRYGAIIGNELLREYVVTLDYRRREAIFERRGN